MKDNAAHKPLYRSEGTKLLYLNSPTGIAITAIAATVLSLTFIQQINAGQKLAWLAAMLLLLSVRVVFLYRWRKAPSSERGNLTWHRRFVALSLSTAACWSAYGLLFWPTFSLEEFTCTIIILSAMTAGAASVLSGDRTLAALYTCFTLLPFSFLLLSLPAIWQRNLGILGIFFAATMVSAAFGTSKYIKEAIRLRAKNQKLLDHMEDIIRKRTKALSDLSRKDPLTGLYNRSTFLLEAGVLMEKYRQGAIDGFAVFFIDLDGFKNINDTRGHTIGDKLLRQTGERLKEFTDENTWFCRWGGDEFVFCTAITDHTELWCIADAMLTRFTMPYMVHDQKVILSAKVGIAVCPEHSEQLEKLIQLADIALSAQKQGQLCAISFYDQALEEALLSRTHMLESLRQALQNHEFWLMYQPVVSAATHTITGFEALIRWRNDGVVISPVEFIPLAEQSGLIIPLGYWVLEEACQVLSSLPQPDISISVNVSLIQMRDPAFISTVARLLERYVSPPGRLHLEVTESVFHAENAGISDMINQLRKMGVKIAIDDFGTGYSSLSVIQHMSVDYVKIDRSFIAHLDDKGSAIVQAVMNISRALHFKVIAEGVETLPQVAFLQNCGVHYLQGYYFSKPLEKDQAFLLLGNQRDSA